MVIALTIIHKAFRHFDEKAPFFEQKKSKIHIFTL